TLDLAISRAQLLGLRGAAFPWRTIRGEECGAYWPAGTAAFHVNADIALAAVRYLQWTGDREFQRDCALPLLVHTARLWLSLGHFGADERFHLDGVTGPDEYSAMVNDNTYTNLMAEAEQLGVTRLETERWLAAAEAVAVPHDEKGMPEQFRDSTRADWWDF